MRRSDSVLHSLDFALRSLLPAAVLILLGSSCSLFSGLSRATNGKADRAAESARLDFEVMRLADQVILEVGASSRQLSRDVGTPEAHVQALTWSVSYTNRVLTIASNSNPVPALVDLLLFVSVQRLLHEKYWIPSVYGEADRPMLESFQRLEGECWNTASQALGEKRQEALRTLLSEWEEQNSDLRNASLLQAPGFSDFAKPPGGSKVPIVSDLLDLVNLDPLAGLEPAVREAALARQLGERIFFFSQHMPHLLSQEVELTILRTAHLPELRSSLEDAERFSLAGESFAATAATLPEAVRTEREAALRQISEELTAQRHGLLADLEQAQAPIASLLTQSRETIDACTRMSESITNGLHSLDAFVSRSKGPQEHASATTPSSPPFDISAYGDAAKRIGTAAHELTVTIETIDQKMPQVEKVLDEAARTAKQSVDYAYGRMLRLLIWAIAMMGMAICAVRAIWWKFSNRSIST